MQKDLTVVVNDCDKRRICEGRLLPVDERVFQTKNTNPSLSVSHISLLKASSVITNV